MSASRALDRAGVDADAEEAAAAAAKEEVLRPMPSVIIAARSAISPVCARTNASRVLVHRVANVGLDRRAMESVTTADKRAT